MPESTNLYRSFPSDSVNTTAPNFTGAVVGSELVSLDELKQFLRVDFELDEAEIEALQISSRISVETISNRILVDREGEASSLTEDQKKSAKICILYKAKEIYHNEFLPDWYSKMINNFSDKIFFL